LRCIQGARIARSDPGSWPAARIAGRFVPMIVRRTHRTMKDPLFLEDAQKLGLDINPLGGEAVGKLVDQMQRTPDGPVQCLRKLLASLSGTPTAQGTTSAADSKIPVALRAGRTSRSAWLVALSFLAFLPSKAAAQGYPDQTIKIVVPSAPAGGYDVVGRLL